MRTGEAAAYLGIDPQTLRRWADEGHLPCERTLTRYRLFDKADLDQLRAELEADA